MSIVGGVLVVGLGLEYVEASCTGRGSDGEGLEVGGGGKSVSVSGEAGSGVRCGCQSRIASAFGGDWGESGRMTRAFQPLDELLG